MPARFVCVLSWAVALTVLAGVGVGQEADDEDFPPGMLARYTVRGKVIERIDPDVAFVRERASPDSRLPTGPFEAQWTSQLLVRQQGLYRFRAYVQGDVVVAVDGKPVLSGRSERPGWVSGNQVSLQFGEKPLVVKFRKTAHAARLHLFWESDRFGLEPIPAHSLFRDGGDAKLARLERGRVLYDVHRCNRCHRRENEPPSTPGPALTHVAAGLDRDWLIAKLYEPAETSPHSRMPSFDFTADEARAMAAFLLSNSKPVKLPQPKPVKNRRKERRKGEILLRSVGCLACHSLGQHGNNGLYGGGDLSTIGRKRSYAWLGTWLNHPEKLNPDHRMPVFKLKDNERRQLALALADLGTGGKQAKPKPRRPNPPDQKLLSEGRKLVEAARCAACHQIPGIQADLSGISDLSKLVGDWSQSCLHPQADRKKQRPAYKQIDHQAVRAYVGSRIGRLSPEGRFARGARLLERRNCVACHQRGRWKGIVQTAGLMARLDDELHGESQTLIPPVLTAVGDKLLDSALAEAVAGRRKRLRLPWLRVRMPTFQHAKEDQAALLAYLIGHDRVPDNPPRTRSPAFRKSRASVTTSQALVAGHELVGAGGFSCIACHQIGSYTPHNVALGTRGSDLMMPAERMRKPYFLRWTRSPLRIVPGMEMPSYVKPVAGILGGQIDAQLEAVWEALNDKRFAVPTDPASVEQFFTVKPGAPARIVRDVFTNPKPNGGGVIARALAVGLGNGHNLMFDLDLLAVRQWTIGDFARQRTVGKSWYWDMAGVPVISEFPQTSDFALQRRSKRTEKLLLPKNEHGTNGRLLGYKRVGLGVEILYDIHFVVDGTLRKLKVYERVQPAAAHQHDTRGGWDRLIFVRGPIPAGYDVLVTRPTSTNAIGSPTIEAVENSGRKWESFPELPGREFTRMSVDSDGVAGVERQRTPNNRGAGGSLRSAPATPSADFGFRRFWRILLRYRCSLKPPQALTPSGYQAIRLSGAQPDPRQLDSPTRPLVAEKVTSLPGFDGVRLPLPRSIMPTAITWTSKGTLAFASLKGHVYLAHDTDGDGLEDKLTVFEEGLAAPFGLIADGEDLIVAHKPEVLRLRDTDGDGRADHRTVVATGWGYTDNYHDWTCSIVRDSKNNFYVGLGSDYAQKNRPRDKSRWRGKVLRIDPRGKVTPVGHAFRYPTGLAINAKDQIFVSDNQGVQNTFNEINYLMPGKHYGVPSRYEEEPQAPVTPAAIQVPHPWTRSVNGLFFLSDRLQVPAFVGHGIGCEYNNRFLIRYTLQQVGDTLQGATYNFSRPDAGTGPENFLGPMCGGVSPKGEILVGSIHDSGWLGGQNTGSITRFRPNGKLPVGIRELRATADGFEITFTGKVDPRAAAEPRNYSISGYTRVWKGGYATPDSGRHKVKVERVEVSADARKVNLHVDRLREGYVYEVSCGKIGTERNGSLWPATGHYSLYRIPCPAS